MRIQARLRNRFAEIAGTASVIAALGILSSGVRAVRADDEPLMSVDPALVSAAARASEKADARPAVPTPTPNPAARPTTSTPPQAVAVAGSPGSPAAPAAFPTVRVDDVENASRPGVSGIEVQPGIVVLNTRGFNYGAPPSPLEREALKQESAPR
jgi:hypothetical protein